MSSNAREAIRNRHELVRLVLTYQTIKGLNLWQKTAVDKSARIKAYYHSMVPS